ncbi:MAG: nucleotidyltransferase domain-containing protein [Chloroflexota bacterium]
MSSKPATKASMSSLEAHARTTVPHLGEQDVRALAEILRRLIAAYAPERVYLFGSKARGDDGPDSDFDVLLVVPEGAECARQGSHLAYEALWGTGTAADVLVWSHDQFESRVHLRASLPGTVLREGRLLYAA